MTFTSDDCFPRAHPQLLFRLVRGETVIFGLCCSRRSQSSFVSVNSF